MLVLAAVGCGGVLATLSEEPILAPPPGGEELALGETDGSTVGFETPARVEVAWGVADGEEVAAWYLRQFGDAYALRRNQDDQWLGLRSTQDMSVTTSVEVWGDVAAAASSDGLVDLSGVEWQGPVVTVMVSADRCQSARQA